MTAVPMSAQRPEPGREIFATTHSDGIKKRVHEPGDRAVQLLIHDGEIDGRRVDVAVDGGMIVAITDVGAGPRAVDTFEAAGGAVIAGLHDHHIHLLALAAARQSIRFDADIVRSLQIADAALPFGHWIRVTGYHESILGEIDRVWLDERLATRPVRVQHRTGAMWVLNSAALASAGIESVDGRLFGADDLIRRRVPSTDLDLAAIGQQLAGFGVTGVSDLTPTTSSSELELLAGFVIGDSFPIDVMVTGGAGLDPLVVPELKRGPVKIVVGDHDLPTIDELVSAFAEARRLRRTVAVHCVTRIGVVLALAAWEEVGTTIGDRIEHGAVIPLELIPTIAAMRLTVVTQPSFVHERGDQYLDDVDTEDISDLWRCGSLIDAGVGVGGSTDAPFGDPDPWRAILAATRRRTVTGAPIGLDERLDARRALQLFQTPAQAPSGRVRSVAVGEQARLCLLRTSLADALAEPSSDLVAATYGRTGLTVA